MKKIKFLAMATVVSWGLGVAVPAAHAEGQVYSDGTVKQGVRCATGETYSNGTCKQPLPDAPPAVDAPVEEKMESAVPPGVPDTTCEAGTFIDGVCVTGEQGAPAENTLHAPVERQPIPGAR